MKTQAQWTGHLLALFSVLVWGTTFVSTKVLLRSFTAVEILTIRFVVAAVLLSLFCRTRLVLQQPRHRWYIAGAGLSGVVLYYLLENIALSYSTASNIGVVISTAPMFTALIAAAFGGERLQPRFFIGFLCALTGIGLISFAGQQVHINPVGDLLALVAAAAWGVYSVLCRKLGEYDYPPIALTRNIFRYGVVMMVPVALLLGFSPSPAALMQPVNLLNLLFLSVLASALCFVTWNMAVFRLGAVRTSVYIYLSPVVTILFAAIVLKERLSLAAAIGTVLVVAGLLVCEGRVPRLGRMRHHAE